MAKMRRFLIAGSRAFNNYYIMFRYLQMYLPKGVVICNGGSNGADQMARVYAECNGHVYEPYVVDWQRCGKNADHIRNIEMVKLVDHAILFWDGKSPGTTDVIECLKKRNINPVIIDITDDDIVKPHPGKVVNVTRDRCEVYIGRGKGSIFGNPFPMSETRDRDFVIAMFTDYLMKTPSLLSKLHTLKDKVLGCFCAPKLCHGDMIVWLLDHAMSEINEICHEKEVKTESPKNPIDLWGELSKIYAKNGSADVLCTSTGLSVAKGYETLVQDGRRFFVEIIDKDICKENLWMTMEERTRVRDENPPKVIYHTADADKVAVFFQAQGFADSPFKTGRWYVDATKVLPKK